MGTIGGGEIGGGVPLTSKLIMLGGVSSVVVSSRVIRKRFPEAKVTLMTGL
jgi:hypothetical protein